jgi:hypothetical protein
MAADSTPMNANSATPAASPMASYRLSPEALNGPKLARETNNQPTTPTNSRWTSSVSSSYSLIKMLCTCFSTVPSVTAAGVGERRARGG